MTTLIVSSFKQLFDILDEVEDRAQYFRTHRVYIARQQIFEHNVEQMEDAMEFVDRFMENRFGLSSPFIGSECWFDIPDVDCWRWSQILPTYRNDEQGRTAGVEITGPYRHQGAIIEEIRTAYYPINRRVRLASLLFGQAYDALDFWDQYQIPQYLYELWCQALADVEVGYELYDAFPETGAIEDLDVFEPHLETRLETAALSAMTRYVAMFEGGYRDVFRAVHGMLPDQPPMIEPALLPEHNYVVSLNIDDDHEYMSDY